MTLRAWGSSLLLCLLVVISCHAVGVPNLHIDELISASDLIVVADVSSAAMIGTSAPIAFRNQILETQLFSSELLVRRTIKGTASGTITVKYTLPKLFIGYRRIEPGTRMVFLRREGENYTIANPYYPDFPALPSLQGRSSQPVAGDYINAVVDRWQQ